MRVLEVPKLFNIAVNDFDARESAPCRWVPSATELVTSIVQ